MSYDKFVSEYKNTDIFFPWIINTFYWQFVLSTAIQYSYFKITLNKQSTVVITSSSSCWCDDVKLKKPTLLALRKAPGHHHRTTTIPSNYHNTTTAYPLMRTHRSKKQSGSSCISRASSRHLLLCTENVAAMDTREKSITPQQPSAMADILHHKDRHSPNQKTYNPRRHRSRPLEPRASSLLHQIQNGQNSKTDPTGNKPRRRESRATALPKNEHIQMWRSKAVSSNGSFLISCESFFPGFLSTPRLSPCSRPLCNTGFRLCFLSRLIYPILIFYLPSFLSPWRVTEIETACHQSWHALPLYYIKIKVKQKKIIG